MDGSFAGLESSFLPVTTGSYLAVQVSSLVDLSAVIHVGPQVPEAVHEGSEKKALVVVSTEPAAA